MWLFRRRSAPPSPERPAVVVHRAMRTDWQSTAPMPIVQARRFGTIDGGFEQILTTRRQQTFLGPLGHELSASAPRGVVSGLARPAPDVHGGVVQRTFASPRSAWTPSDSSTPTMEDVGDEPSSAAGADPISNTAAVPVLDASASWAELPPASTAMHLPLATQRAVLDGSTTSSAAPAAAAWSPDAGAPSWSAPPSTAADTALRNARPATPDATPVRPSPSETTLVPLSTQRAPLSADDPAVVSAAGPAAPGRPPSKSGASGAATTPTPAVPAQRRADAPGPRDPRPASPATGDLSSSESAEPTVTGPVADGAADTVTALPAGELPSWPSPVGATPTIVPMVGGAPGLDTSAGGGRPLAPHAAVTTSIRTFAVQRRTRIGSPLHSALGPTPASPAGPPGPGRSTSPGQASAGSASPIGSPSPSHPSVPTTGAPRSPIGEIASDAINTSSAAVWSTGALVAPVVSRTAAAPSPRVRTAWDGEPADGSVDAAWPDVGHSRGVWTESISEGTPDAASVKPAERVAVLASRPLVTTTAGPSIDGRLRSAAPAAPAAGTIQRSPGGAAPAGSSTTVPMWSRRSTLPVSVPSTVGAPARAVQRWTIPGAGGGASRPADTASSSPWRSASDDRGSVAPVVDFGGFEPAADGTLWAADTAVDAAGDVVAIQRADDDAREVAPPSGAPSAGSTVVATPSTGPAAPAGAPPSDTQIQELCRALYAPLHRRLCRDLLVDRERSGYRTDIRF